MSKSFSVWIGWGEMPEAEQASVRYDFASAAMLDAFLYGVDEASGWLNYKSFETPNHWDSEMHEWVPDEQEKS